MAWFPKQMVVVPIDFSAASLAAIDVGLQVVDDPSHLHVVHVLIDTAPLEAGEIWGVVDSEARSAHAEKVLRQQLDKSRYAGVRSAVLVGDPAHGIANFAQDKNADLIVIPSHGRTGLTRLLIGSVAERVVRLAHCPVLVLRN